MSTQTRMYQFFKCTSGNKGTFDSSKQQPTKLLKGPKVRGKSSVKNACSRSSSFKEEANKGKKQSSKDASPETELDDIIFLECRNRESDTNAESGIAGSSRSKSQSSNNETASASSDDSLPVVNLQRKPTKTIKEFVIACNSPKKNYSNAATQVDRTAEINRKSHLSQNYQQSTQPQEIKLGGSDSIPNESIKTEPHSNNEQFNSNKTETTTTPKKRKIEGANRSRDSPSKCRKAFSPETPDYSMTAMSMGWQDVLQLSDASEVQEDVDNEADCSMHTSISHFEANPNVGKEVSLDKKVSSENKCRNSNEQTPSPRRALFSPQSSVPQSVIKEELIIEEDPLFLDNDVPMMSVKTEDISQAPDSNTEMNDFLGETKDATIKSEEETSLMISVDPLTFVETICDAEVPEGSFISPQRIKEGPKPLKQERTPLKPPTKRLHSWHTPTKSPSELTNNSQFSPRKKFTPSKAFKNQMVSNAVDLNLATKAVENLNEAKQGIISQNEFDLETIYAEGSFVLEYGKLKPDTAVRYETKDVQVPEDKHGDHFFMVLGNVFSEPLNCGYFDEKELDTIFSLFTLRPEAQSLLTRMLKRKRGWHRVSNIKYEEIAPDLSPIFRELVNRGFLDDGIAGEDISSKLNILQLDEVRTLCRTLKVNNLGQKAKLIEELVSQMGSKTSLYPGIKSPSSVLNDKCNTMLDFCIRLPDKIENLLVRIFVLLIPNQDSKENMAEAFRMLTQVHFGQKKFPETPKERFPLFRNRSHLLRDENRTLKLPSHVRRFEAIYPWVKVMSESVEGFKKNKESIAQAAEFLHVLLSPKDKIPGYQTQWYCKLALIESYHLKNFETSADVIIRALSEERLSEIDAAEIFETARKLAKKKALTTITKGRLDIAVSNAQQKFPAISEPTFKTIEANCVGSRYPGAFDKTTKSMKSTWSVNMGGTDTGFLKVEDVALRNYLKAGFRDGVHCEGALPVTLFATLLWDEIYTHFVPGAFASPYQVAPLDIHSSNFFETRRELLENRLKFIRALDADQVGDIMCRNYEKYRNYDSLMHGYLFQKIDDYKHLIMCLGVEAVVGIAERLATNYNQWKSGFPDLAVWNPATGECKIVEVKGPGDSLSTKQKLWIDFLQKLGVGVEVCLVKSKSGRYD